MAFTRNITLAAVAGVVVGLVVGSVPAVAATADARTPRPLITSVQADYGSSVGYAHVIIRGRHLTGGTVTIAGRRAYSHVINSKVIAAFPAGHRHGKRFAVVVRTKAGSSNHKSYEFRYAHPSRLRATAATAAPGRTVATLGYSITRCPAVGTCISIGGDALPGPVARVTTRGHTVTQRIPVPADTDGDNTPDLVDLSCPSVTFCAAVGSYNASTNGLLSTWNGTTWTSRRSPVPANSDPLHDLSHVSCGAPGRCVVLDEENNVYTLDNGTFAVATLPAPAGYKNLRPAHVACPAPGWCLVTGSGDVGKTERNFVAVRKGSPWTSRPMTNPPGWKATYAPDLPGLDCRYTDYCTVLAGGRDSDPIAFGVLHAGATTWRSVALPADADRSAAWSIDFENTRVTCPTSNTCWTFAAYSVRGLSGQRGYQPVAVRLHDASVRVFPLPRPASSRTGRFTVADLSCATADSCVAVGTRGDRDVNNIHGDAIVETYANGVWTPAAAPSPAGRPKYSGYEFTSIDCAGVRRCTATGDYNYDHNPDAEDGQPLEKSRPVVLDVAPR